MPRSPILTERKPSEPDPEAEIPYLRCKECDTPCYVFETNAGRVREALCIACGNDSVTLFSLGKWDEDDED
jgi:ribosomal protein S27E